jgi:hypothetical protein
VRPDEPDRPRARRDLHTPDQAVLVAGAGVQVPCSGFLTVSRPILRCS